MSTPVFGVVGWKNSGKTTLTERLVSEFTARGLTVSMDQAYASQRGCRSIGNR